MMKDEEYELTLAVVAPEPVAVVRAVSSLTSLARYRLVEKPLLTLNDTYWDCPDGRLGEAGVALRLRSVEGETNVTLKGPGRASRVGVRRFEIERKWSETAFTDILEQLAATGLGPPEARGAHFADEASAALRRGGFLPVQERETTRAPRDIVSEYRRDAGILGELAVDATRYRIGQRQIVHYEVEIEAKGPGGEAAIGDLHDALLGRCGTELRVWNHGKLSTGKAIAALIQRGALQHLCSSSGELLPAAYELIASEFGGGNG